MLMSSPSISRQNIHPVSNGGVFGDEGKSPIKSNDTEATLIKGLGQLYLRLCHAGKANGIRLLVAVEQLPSVHTVGRSTCINLTLHGE